jgi:hypothetical protein
MACKVPTFVKARLPSRDRAVNAGAPAVARRRSTVRC